MSVEVNIPRLDLDDYIKGTPKQKKQFSDAIGKAFNETGFVTISNHGMDKDLIAKLYIEVKAFFVLIFEVTAKILFSAISITSATSISFCSYAILAIDSPESISARRINFLYTISP